MITYHRTSILSSQAQTVVNTVNTVGVMGKGLASEFKARYPDMYEKYRKYCSEGLLEVGKLWLWKGDGQWVLNFPTKKHWRQPSKLEYVESGLKKFVDQYEARGITEIAFPRLGCGNGGLDWAVVQKMMEHYLSNLPIPVYIHDFEKNIGLPEHKEDAQGFDLFASDQRMKSKSFPEFEKALSELISRSEGSFRTVKRGSEFLVKRDDETGDLTIILPKKERVVSRDDIYELWDMLLKGPVTKDQISGSAWEAAYFLFSILSRLPFIRPIEVASKAGEETIAVELIRDIIYEPVR